MRLGVWARIACVLAVLPAPPLAAAHGPESSTDRIIIKLRTSARPADTAVWHSLSQHAGVRIAPARTLASGVVVAHLDRVSLARARQLTARLEEHPEVVYAEPDRVMQPFATPSDVYYGAQWNLFEFAGADVAGAWDITPGDATVVVGVLDTGVLRHEDLSRVLPGYDFISADSDGKFARANDGDGRDADASDPGDWITTTDTAAGELAGCRVKRSSWHGTHVAGILAADTDNGRGIAGIDRAARVLPVRVLGKCGGYVSDIIDGLYWAGGFSVPGAPANPHPARVLNLSFGASTSTCPRSLQEGVEALLKRGVVVIAAAGNKNVDAAGVAPANCFGVIAVGATDRGGVRAAYSNYGKALALSAPGGIARYENDPDGIWSTLNEGQTRAANDSYGPYEGTSMAAAHVAGVVSLMLALDPALAPPDVLGLLRESARPFSVASGCEAGACGAGLVDAAAAVTAARDAQTLATAVTPPVISTAEQDPQLTAGASNDDEASGCTRAPGRSTPDPTLPALLLLAAGALRRRRGSD